MRHDQEYTTEVFVRNWLAAWSGSADELLTYYHPQASYCDPSLNEPVIGHQNLHRYFSALLQKFPGWKWELVELFDHPQVITLKWKATFIINDQPIILYGMDIVELREHQIIRNEVYFDRPDFLRKKDMKDER